MEISSLFEELSLKVRPQAGRLLKLAGEAGRQAATWTRKDKELYECPVDNLHDDILAEAKKQYVCTRKCSQIYF